VEQDEIRSFLAEHLASIQSIVAMRRGEVHPEVAAARLDMFWKTSCRLARLTDSESMSPEQREMAASLVRLSRETVGLKRREFGLEGWSDSYRPGWDEPGGGSAPVPAWVRPGPPPRSGRDAKPFPPEEVHFPGEFDSSPEART
jgi:hypothetical protein